MPRMRSQLAGICWWGQATAVATPGFRSALPFTPASRMSERLVKATRETSPLLGIRLIRPPASHHWPPLARSSSAQQPLLRQGSTLPGWRLEHSASAAVTRQWRRGFQLCSSTGLKSARTNPSPLKNAEATGSLFGAPRHAVV